MGKPGAILLIGAGVFILILGWEGRLSAVWDIMKGGVPDLPNPGDILPGPDKDTDGPSGPDLGWECDLDSECPVGQRCIGEAGKGSRCTTTESPGNGGECGQGRQRVTVMTSGATKCVAPTDLAATENGSCRNGYVLVNRPNPDGSATALCLRTVRGAGAVANDYGWVMQPTGAMVRRYQPNVRGID